MKRLPLVLLAGMSALGITILFTMTGLADDLYTFRDRGGPSYFTNVPGPGRSKVRLPVAKLQPRYSKISAIPRRGCAASPHGPDYSEVILSACKRFSVDPDLVRAVIKAESNFDPQALSPKGAMGLMQLMPDTARDMGVSDPFDPVENIHGGVGYLSRLLTNQNGDLIRALAAYNAGPTRVMTYGGIPPFRETWNYVKRVMNYYQIFKGKEDI